MERKRRLRVGSSDLESCRFAWYIYGWVGGESVGPPIKMLFRLVFAAWYRLYLVLVASPAIL